LPRGTSNPRHNLWLSVPRRSVGVLWATAAARVSRLATTVCEHQLLVRKPVHRHHLFSSGFRCSVGGRSVLGCRLTPLADRPWRAELCDGLPADALRGASVRARGAFALALLCAASLRPRRRYDDLGAPPSGRVPAGLGRLLARCARAQYWDLLFGTLTRMTREQHDKIVFGVRELPRRDCLKPSAVMLTPWRIARAARTTAREAA
jgi:hypothetical protein